MRIVSYSDILQATLQAHQTTERYRIVRLFPFKYHESVSEGRDYEWPIVLGIESKFVSSKKRPESDKDKNKMSLYAPHLQNRPFPAKSSES